MATETVRCTASAAANFDHLLGKTVALFAIFLSLFIFVIKSFWPFYFEHKNERKSGSVVVKKVEGAGKKMQFFQIGYVLSGRAYLLFFLFSESFVFLWNKNDYRTVFILCIEFLFLFVMHSNTFFRTF